MDAQAQFAYPPNAGHYGPVTAPTMFFNHKTEKIDWRRIASVDLNRITKDLDFTSLQDTITSIAFCDIERELDSRYIEPNFIRLFRLAQLQIQYLLYSQDYLTGTLAGEADRTQAAADEVDKLRRELSSLRERHVELKKQCHRYKKMVRIQQMLMPSSHDLHHPCPHCDKKFISHDFLANHLERRHRGQQLPLVVHAGNVTKEIDELRNQVHQKNTEIEMLRRQIQDGGNMDFTSMRHEMMEQHKSEMDAFKSMFMEELKELNTRYLESQKALQEMRVKQKPGSRSNLGDLEDDDEVDSPRKKESAKLRAENMKLKEEVAREKAISEKRKKNLDRYRSEQEKRKHEATELVQNREWSVVSDLDDSEVTPIDDSHPLTHGNLRPTSTPKRQVISGGDPWVKKKPVKEEEMIQKRTPGAAAARTPSGDGKGTAKHPQVARPPPAVHSSDESESLIDDDSADASDSEMVSREMKKLADTDPVVTGEMSPTSSWDISQLRSSRVMEKLKAEPSLLQGFISELRDLLEERLMDLGVDRTARRLPTPVLNEKLGILRKERDQLTRKHAQFASIRQQYIREVEKEAQEKLRNQSPPGFGRNRNPPPSNSHSLSPGAQRKMGVARPPPRPSPQMERRSNTLPTPTSHVDAGLRTNTSAAPPPPPHPPQLAVPSLHQRDLDVSSESDSSESYSAMDDHRRDRRLNGRENELRPSPPPHAPGESDVRPSPRKPRQHRPLSASNGGTHKLDSPESLNDWDTTDGRRANAPPHPRPTTEAVRVPARNAELDDSESGSWESETDDLQRLENEISADATGGMVTALSQSLEAKMNQPREVRVPAGGVDIMPGGAGAAHVRRDRQPDDDDILGDLDDDDAFDVSSLNGEDSRPPSRKVSGNGVERGLFGGNVARASVGSSGGAGAQTTSPSGQLRLSAAGTDLSNTFGTSQWGTTSKESFYDGRR